MSWLSTQEMRELEEQAFARGVEAGALMDLAAAGIARRLLNDFPRPGCALGVIGKGNNGGDVVAALEILQRHGWQVAVIGSVPPEQCLQLTQERLQRAKFEMMGTPDELYARGREFFQIPGPGRQGARLILDGMLGIGAKGELREPLREMARQIEELRQAYGAQVAAIDLPSGLEADLGMPLPGCVRADLTITIGAVKQGLLAESAVEHVGRLSLVSLDELPAPQERTPRLACPDYFSHLMPRRGHKWHKGTAGRVLVLAGSLEMSGAAELCTEAALRGGAGLVTLFSEPQNPVRPRAEVITKRRRNRFEAVFEAEADARIIGPGLGEVNPANREILFDHLLADELPTVLDADALNLLAEEGRLDLLKENHLITPHPGEFARLAPDLAKLPRNEAVREFTKLYPCTLLLKGARTLIARGGECLYWNPTGHAGMASAGQGDVLAGVCGALLAAKIDLPEAGMLAAWLCGRAAEHAVLHGRESEQSILASDTLANLGAAFRDWAECRR